MSTPRCVFGIFPRAALPNCLKAQSVVGSDMVTLGKGADMGLPDFFIIGAPKCGTTTLYQWLGQHPQVHAPHKEPGFFSQDVDPTAHLATHIPTLDDYKAIFDSSDPMVKISGEATPKYLYSDNALERISKLRPDAKIIVCLRDPVDLAISFHNQKVKEGVETEVDFSTAWGRSISSGPVTSPWVDDHINYAFWACFGQRLEQVFERFPTENIRIYTITELKREPEAVFQDLCSFLAISQDQIITFEAANVGYQMRSPNLHLTIIALKRKAAPLLRLIAKIRGKEGLGLLKLAKRLNSSGEAYSDTVPSELRAEMRRSLADDQDIARVFLKGKPL